MITTDIKLHGFDQLKDMLRVLPEEVRMKVNQPAARSMIQLTHTLAVMYAPEGKTKALRRNIKIIKKKTEGKWRAIYGLRVKTARRATVRRGNRGTARPFLEGFLPGEKAAAPKGPDDPYYWFFLEFGTVYIAERKFLRNALEGHHGQHIGTFERVFQRGLEREVRKQYGVRFRNVRASMSSLGRG